MLTMHFLQSLGLVMITIGISFTRWIDTKPFYAPKKTAVRVEVENAVSIYVDVPKCEACHKCMEESRLVDKMISID